MSIVSRIKALAPKYGFTISSLEQEASLGNGTIRRWDNNIPSADKMLKIANLLNTSIEYLLMGIDNNIEKNEKDSKILKTFHQLNEDNQDIIIGKMKELLKEQKYEESVAADNLKEAK